jgi:hypothetical protein
LAVIPWNPEAPVGPNRLRDLAASSIANAETVEG